MSRPLLDLPAVFTQSVVEKVERLLEVLSALDSDPFLGRMFVLHGGTALNLFYDEAPRLSVDIDLMFTGAVELDEMREMRPQVDERFREVVVALGYAVQGTNDEHSGQTYRVRYGNEYIKVDISYLARVTLLDPERLRCSFADPPVVFPTLRVPELVAGKVKALLERRAARDLYDLYRLSTREPALLRDPLARALAVRAVSVADPFPRVKTPSQVLNVLESPPSEYTEPLIAMLPVGERPDYEELLDSVRHWLSPLDTLTPPEAEFMRLLDQEADYRPGPLFAAWPGVLERAQADPVMAWKVQNLSRRSRDGK